jgi:NAD(P)-dependent dehydrogenase (short-subunit alcohol dehydrogenase family)
MQEFKGRVAVVTGAASGMGLAFATRFAEEGMNVVLADIDAEPLAMAEAELRNKGVAVMAQRLDVARPEQVDALADEVFARFGNVHVLCNNAGVGGPRGRPLWDLSLGDWQWAMGVNLWGVINGIRAFLPRMVANDEEGHVVNTASQAAVNFGGGVYGVTKFGVMAISEALYFELGAMNSKIGVSVLCPGWVATNIADSDRHRPPEYGEPLDGRPPLEAGEEMRELGRKMLASGYPPSYIADVVVQAIRDRKFYLLPAQEYMHEGMAARHRCLETENNPEIVNPLARMAARAAGEDPPAQ